MMDKSQLERLVADNPNLRLSVIVRLTGATYRNVKIAADKVSGKKSWVHNGVSYPFLGTSKDNYAVRYGGANLYVGPYYQVIDKIDELINELENNEGILPCEIEGPLEIEEMYMLKLNRMHSDGIAKRVAVYLIESRGRGMTLRDIADKYGLTPKQVRVSITNLRRTGWKVENMEEARGCKAPARWVLKGIEMSVPTPPQNNLIESVFR